MQQANKSMYIASPGLNKNKICRLIALVEQQQTAGVCLQVHLFQQGNILCPAVVAVAGDIPGITVLCFARRMAEGIPDGQSPAILLHCALDLIGCGCRAPDEILRK